MRLINLNLNPSSLFLLYYLLFSQCNSPTNAAKNSYVVYVGEHSHGSEFSSGNLNRVTESHCKFIRSFLQSNDNPQDAIFYSYTRHIAAAIDETVAAENIQKLFQFFVNQGRKLHTTHSWEFLGLKHNDKIESNSIWKKARYGEDTIIGNLDTGVWPESKSFGDEGLGPIPSKWKGLMYLGN